MNSEQCAPRLVSLYFKEHHVNQAQVFCRKNLLNQCFVEFVDEFEMLCKHSRSKPTDNKDQPRHNSIRVHLMPDRNQYVRNLLQGWKSAWSRIPSYSSANRPYLSGVGYPLYVCCWHSATHTKGPAWRNVHRGLRHPILDVCHCPFSSTIPGKNIDGVDVHVWHISEISPFGWNSVAWSCEVSQHILHGESFQPLQESWTIFKFNKWIRFKARSWFVGCIGIFHVAWICYISLFIVNDAMSAKPQTVKKVWGRSWVLAAPS